MPGRLGWGPFGRRHILPRGRANQRELR